MKANNLETVLTMVYGDDKKKACRELIVSEAELEQMCQGDELVPEWVRYLLTGESGRLHQRSMIAETAIWFGQERALHEQGKMEGNPSLLQPARLRGVGMEIFRETIAPFIEGFARNLRGQIVNWIYDEHMERGAILMKLARQLSDNDVKNFLKHLPALGCDADNVEWAHAEYSRVGNDVFRESFEMITRAEALGLIEVPAGLREGKPED